MSEKYLYDRMDLPKSLNVITGTGMSYRRLDGINVILMQRVM